MPNKDLGQHWLFDELILESIADFAEIKAGDKVVEVGPGLGTLTDVLLEYEADVTAVEFDPDLAKDLELNKKGKNLKVVNQDILKFDFSKIDNPYKVIGNIPYYLTSKLIRNLLELKNQPDVIVLLIQKEVAERIVAKPGKMSVLSVAAQVYADCELGLEVSAQFFTPPPKVDSQVVRLVPNKAEENFDSNDFFRIVKAGFGERRKKLVNSLSGGLQIEKEKVKSILNELSLSENVRAQELSVDDWKQLQEHIKNS